MPMKVENELMDGKNIENWLRSAKGRTSQYSEVSHQAQEAHSRWAGIWPLDISPLISVLWDSWSNGLLIY
jgi:hypothetical protein